MWFYVNSYGTRHLINSNHITNIFYGSAENHTVIEMDKDLWWKDHVIFIEGDWINVFKRKLMLDAQSVCKIGEFDG